MSRLERIVAACGGILLDGGTRALIPGPNHSHKDRSVSLRLTEEGRILIHCFSPKDDWREVRRALTDRGLLDDEPRADVASTCRSPSRIVAQPLDEERVARAGRLWEESTPLKHSVAEAYLRRRVVPAGLWESIALRFHPRMTSLDDRARRPALVAAISDAQGALQGVQVTLLSAHGTAKAAVVTPRRVIGKLMGGTVRLADAQDELAIGEGVETMLTASDVFGVPAWAALSADNLARLIISHPLRRLIIAADNDEAGMRAAESLRSRMTSSTIVEIEAAPPGFNDWNDWARAQTSGS
jgi:putative DNA primase/helicase